MVQHDAGLSIECEVQLHRAFPNLLVLSAGGFGHVPIPLMKQEEPALAPATRNTPPDARRHFVSYVGSLGNAPHDLRDRMVELMEVSARQVPAP